MPMPLRVRNMKPPNTGFLVLGDIHGNLPSFKLALEYAEKNDLFIISLGDVVDYGEYSAECFSLLHDRCQLKKATMVMGNHDYKNHRFFKQRRAGNITIKQTTSLTVSVKSFDKHGEETIDRLVSFLDNVPHIISFSIGDQRFVFTHAAIDPRFWSTAPGDADGKTSKSLTSFSLYGEIDKTVPTREDNRPNRIYNWMDEVPENTNVFIGHDIFDSVKPYYNKNGGAVYRIDTGSSKGGYLSGVVVNQDASKKVIKTFN